MPGHDGAWRERRLQIDALFTEATELPPPSRAAFLNSACRGDDVLRREVESLLAYDSGNQDSIACLIEEAAAALFENDLPEGERIGPYRILREIGRGGMGAVYLAVRDDDAYRKNVAIKLVKRGMDTDAVTQRFRQERQVLANLDHPYIAKLLDGGTAPDGRPYFVMEYVEGMSITSYAKAHSLSVAARCSLFRKVCEAISHAHRALVVHRDLKPGNILVPEDGAPKLLDFGIAKMLTPALDASVTAVNDPHARIATIDYASPEQLLGGPVTTAADVYSLGVILYELLTGALPFAHRQDADKERAICEETPRPASSAVKLDPDLDNIIAMALRKEPERRYRSADELSEDIDRHFAGLPVIARGDRFSYRAGKFLRRHRIGVAAAAVAAGGLLTGAGVALREARVADAQRARAEQRLGQLVELANRTLFEMNDSLERAPGTMETRRQLVKSTLDYLDSIHKDAGGDANFQNALGNAYLRIGDIQGAPGRPNLGDTAGALESYRAALKLYQASGGRSDAASVRRLVDAETNIGRELNALGRRSEGQAALDQAIAAGEEGRARFPSDDPVTIATADAYNSRANVDLYANSAGAVKTNEKAIGLLAPIAGRRPEDRDLQENLASYYETTGIAHHNLGGHLREALAAYRKSLDISERLAQRDPQDVMLEQGLMHANADVGDILADPFKENLGDPMGAAPYYQRMVAIAEAAASADPTNAEARYDLAQALMRYGYSMTAPAQKQESLAALRRAVAIAQEAHRGDSANLRYWRVIGLAHERLGARQRDSGDWAGAIETFRSGRAVAQAILTADSSDAAAYTILFELERLMAETQAGHGDRTAISTIADCAAQMKKRAGRPNAALKDRALLPQSSLYMGRVYAELARHGGGMTDWDRARAAFDQAIAGYSALAGEPESQKLASEMKSAQAQLSEAGQMLERGRVKER